MKIIQNPHKTQELLIIKAASTGVENLFMLEGRINLAIIK
jgi:hypothetical protein